MKRVKLNLKPTLVRYALSYTAFFACMLVIIAAFMYFSFSKTVREQYNRNGEDLVETVAQSHKVRWDGMNNTANEFVTSTEYMPFVFEQSPAKAQKLIARLKELKSVNDYYATVLLAYNTDGYLYTNNTSCRRDRTLAVGLIYENLEAEQLDELMRTLQKPVILPVQYVSGCLAAEGYYATYLFPIANRKDAVSLFLVPQSNLEKSINIENAYLWLYDISGLCLYGADAIKRDVFEEAISNQKSVLQYEGAEYMIFSYFDESIGVTYYLLQPVLVLTQALWNSARTVLLFSLFLTIPALFIILVSSMRFGRKIHGLRQIVAPHEEVDSIENIESAAKDLVSRVTRLDTALDENTEMKRNLLVRRLMQDGAENTEQICEEGKEVGLDLSGAMHAVLLTGTRGEKREDTLMELNRALCARAWGIEVLPYKQALFLLSGDSQEELDKAVCELETSIRASGLSGIVAISAYHDKTTDLPLAFLEAQSAYDMRFLRDTDLILRYDDTETAMGIDYPMRYIDMLKNAIRTRDREKSNQAIGELMQYAKGRKLSMSGFRLMYNDIIHVLLSEYREKELREDSAQIYSIFSLSHCLTIAELNKILSNLCSKLIDRETPQSASSGRMSEIAEYIRTHYVDPNLSMNAVASAFDISPVTFSIAFKEEMGMSPSDYLMMTRMEQAKILLSSTDDMVRDIGIAVGLSDIPGFQRKFKAYTSMTPTQYRTRAKEEQ